jgi:hypothetical protein
VFYRTRSEQSNALKCDYFFSWTGNHPDNWLVNSAEMRDEVHTERSRGIPGDQGGPMDLTKITYEGTPSGKIEGAGTGGRYWLCPTGVVPIELLNENFNDAPFSGPYSDVELLGMGATAIARTTPTNPSFSLANAIGEFRSDGMPSPPGADLASRVKYLKNSGSEYLNVEFGWAPLVSDVKNFARTVKDSHKILKQFQKGSDKRIRRRYTFPTEEYSRINRGAGVPYPNVDANLSQFMSDGLHIRTQRRETWFSGAFRYHIPIGDSLVGKFAEWETKADKLLGIEPTPKQLWELTPWSWAIDWYSNMGDVYNNISRLGNDGLVLEYGYIMSKYTQSDDLVAYDYFGKPGRLRISKKVLKRRQATPYGFGFNMANLSAKQEAVLVALGLSKGAR